MRSTELRLKLFIRTAPHDSTYVRLLLGPFALSRLGVNHWFVLRPFCWDAQ